MKWNHLPEPGGLYQQNPQLLERFNHIFTEQNKREAAEREKENANMGGGRGRGASRSPARGRRRH